MISLLNILTGLAVASVALGSGTPVARSFVSGGVTCYYQCPATATEGGNTIDYYAGSTDSNVITCEYGYPENFLFPGDIVDCYYSASDGSFESSNPSTGYTCGALAVVCGSQPDRGFKKRSSRERRLMTEREKVIAERQFKPAKPVSA